MGGICETVIGTVALRSPSTVISKRYCPACRNSVEYQHSRGFDFGYSGRRLGEVYRTGAPQELGTVFVHELDLDLMLPHLGALSFQTEHQMQSRMHGGELRHPDVLEDPEHGHLARLIDQGVIGDNREIEMHAPTCAAR
jgi:hypothetical protein